MRLTLNLPAVVTALDYHEFGNTSDLLSDLSGKRVKHVEMGFTTDCLYAAVLYVGRRPLKKVRMKMLDDAGMELVK